MELNRDPAFWEAVIAHPDVGPNVTFGQEIDVAGLVQHPGVVPLASEHGGFVFVQLDALGRVWELHTAYRPEGWGREVLFAAKSAFTRMFADGADLITTHEVEGNWRSRPPKTFRFEPAGEFRQALGKHLRTWMLTRAAWEASPARQRME